MPKLQVAEMEVMVDGVHPGFSVPGMVCHTCNQHIVLFRPDIIVSRQDIEDGKSSFLHEGVFKEFVLCCACIGMQFRLVGVCEAPFDHLSPRNNIKNKFHGDYQP